MELLLCTDIRDISVTIIDCCGTMLLTWLGCFLLPDRLQHRDDTVGLHGGEHPVFGLIDVGHIDPQAAVFTQ